VDKDDYDYQYDYENRIMRTMKLPHPENGHVLNTDTKQPMFSRFCLTVPAIPVLLMLVWLFWRPLYFAGRAGSPELFLIAEMFTVLMFLAHMSGVILVFWGIIYYAIRRHFKKSLVCCVFGCVIICSLLIVKQTTNSPNFRFEYGFGKWVLRNADLEMMHGWRATLELDKWDQATGIPKKAWPDFVSKLSPKRVSCESLEDGSVEVVLRWRGGVRRLYGLTIRSKNQQHYSPNWRGPILEVSPGVYVWWF